MAHRGLGWGSGSSSSSSSNKRAYTDASASVSALHRIHWLRLVVDEGHTIGRGSGGSNASLMAASLSAERRWVLTGTPTPSGQQVCCAVVCCAVLCCAMLCCAVLCCVVVCYAVV
jgi:hypothetical protein